MAKKPEEKPEEVRPVKTFEEIWHPTEKQKEATELLEKYKYILYGGAVGGGKSYWLRWALVRLLLKWFKEGHKGVRVGLFCEDYPALKDRHLARLMYEFPKWLGTLNKADYEFTLNKEYGGGVICFRNLDDASKYMSAEFAAIAVDELTKNKKEVFDFLRTRLRWSGISDVKFLAASNPGGIGHNWVKSLWMDKKFEETEKEKHLFYFIPAKAVDNPHLDQSYFYGLEGLPPDMRRAFIEGNWDLFKGQYFTEWERSKHIRIPFAIPATWRKFRAYDYGRDKPACCLWLAVDQDGRVWVYREFYQEGMNVDQQSKKIKQMTPEDEEIEWTVADPSIFTKGGLVDRKGGETIAETFYNNGIPMIAAPKGKDMRVSGWNLMHQYLYWDKNTLPRLIFFNTCENCIRTIPTLIHDEHKPEDLDSRGEDHCADTLRYFLTTIQGAKTQSEYYMTATEKRLKEYIASKEPKVPEIYEDNL